MVICQICRKEFKRITRTHLQQHGLTTKEYQKQFPDAETIDQGLRETYGKFFRESNPMKLEENKKYFSELHTGKEFTEEHCQNISKSKLGKSNGLHSEETNNKISASNRETNRIKKENGYIRPKYVMCDEARERSSIRMMGNTLGKTGHHNKGKILDLTDEQRKNRSIKRVTYLSENKGVRSGTKPELKFIDFLRENNIKYEHQFPIHTNNSSWLYDFWLPDLNLFVEIDGEYWHCKKKTMNRDKFKNKIIQDLDKTLARISTNDLNFTIIFETAEIIWQKNKEILEKRKIND